MSVLCTICINLHLAASQKPLAHFVAGKQPMLNLQVVKRKWERQGGIARVKSFFRLASHAGVFRGAPSSQTPAQPKTTLLSHCFICLVSDQPINVTLELLFSKNEKSKEVQRLLQSWFKTTCIVFYNNISAGHTSLLQVYRCYSVFQLFSFFSFLR